MHKETSSGGIQQSHRESGMLSPTNSNKLEDDDNSEASATNKQNAATQDG